MPNQRPPTPEEAEELKAKGIDPSKGYILDDNTPGTQNNTGGNNTSGNNTNGVLSTVAKTAAAHAGGYIGGGLGMGGALAGLSWLAGPEVGLPATLLAGAVGGMGGAAGGQKLQEVIGGSGQEALEKSAEEAGQEHPYIAEATDITGSALAGGGWPSLKNLGSAGKQLLGRNALSEADSLALRDLGESGLGSRGTEQIAAQNEGKDALGKIIGSAILNPAINTGLDLATGQPITSGGVASQVIGGALFSEQSRLGKMLTGHKDEPLPETSSKDITTQPTDKSLSGDTIYNQKNEQGNYTISDQLIKSQFLKKNLYTTSELGKMPEEERIAAQQENINHRANVDYDSMRAALHAAAIDTQSKTSATPADVNKPSDQSLGATTPSAPTGEAGITTDANKQAPPVEDNGARDRMINDAIRQNNELKQRLATADSATTVGGHVPFNAVNDQPAIPDHLTSAASDDNTSTQAAETTARQTSLVDAVREYNKSLISGEGIAEAKAKMEGEQQRFSYHIGELAKADQLKRAAIDRESISQAQEGEAVKNSFVQNQIDEENAAAEAKAKAGLTPPRPPLNPDKNNMMRILNPKSIAASMQKGITDTTGLHTWENVDNWLESKKFDSSGKMFDAMQGIPITIWNGSIDAIRLGIKAGKAIHEAVKDGIAYIRANHKGKFDEERYVKEMTRQDDNTKVKALQEEQSKLAKGDPFDPKTSNRLVEIGKQMEEIKNRNKGYVPGTEPKQEGEHGVPFDTTSGKRLNANEPIYMSFLHENQPHLDSIANHIKSGKATTGSVLKIISEGPSKFADLAKEMLDSAKLSESKEYDWVQNNLKTNDSVNHSDAFRTSYSPRLHASNIRTEHLNDLTIIMHELSHSLTSNNLEHAFSHEINKTYEEALSQIGGKVPPGTYGLSNIHEFVAEALTNPKFQSYLNEAKSGLNDGRSLWTRLVDSIRKILGVSVKEGSLLERTLRATKLEMESPRHNQDSFKMEHFAEGEKDKEPQGKVSRLGKLGGLTEPIYDRIADLAHPAARAVADAFRLTDNTRDQYLGESWGKIKQTMDRVGFTKHDGEVLDKISQWENLNHQKAPLSMFRTRAQMAVYNIERQVYDETGKRRIANNEPVYRNGKPTVLRQDPTAHPTPLAPKIAEIYKTGTDTNAIAKHDAEFIANAKQHGYTPEQAAKLLADFKDTIQGSMKRGQSNMSFFGGSRLSQGVPLPPSFTKGSYANRLESYYKRMALDNSFYKHVESNPTVMSALGESKDAWGRVIPKMQQNIAGNDYVRIALKQFQGEATDTTSRTEGSITNLASTLFVSSPVIEMHKILSNTLNGALAIADNPIEAARTFSHMMLHISDGIQHATENGLIKMTAKSAGDFFDSSSTTAERFQALSQGWRNISSLGGRTDKWNSGLMQAGFESAIPGKIAKANKGDVTAQQLLKKWDPTYTVGKEYSTKEIQQLASIAAGYVHGTKDGRTMPPWMMKDTELSGFFKLAHWSVSQTNRFMSDVYTPATKGNMIPMVNALLGSAVGGYVIKQLREELQGKHGNIPDFKEIAASQGGLAGNKNLVAYNLMSALQYAGFAGIISQGIKTPVDWMYKNSPQGAVFPLDEITSDLVSHLGKLTTAAANDPNFDWGNAAVMFWSHMISSDVQLTRIAFNQGVNNGMITGLPADKKILSDKLGQLRRFDMVSGLPYDDQEPSQANPYMNIEQKKFKTEQDIGTAMKELPGLIQNIFTTYADKPDVMMSKLKALKQNSYEAFPSLQDKAPSFMKYMNYLEALKGKEGADKDYMDYLQHKVINEAKASAVP